MKVRKFKSYPWLGVTVNYDTVQYFYKIDSWRWGDLPKYRVFILDPDGFVYEILVQCACDEIEEEVIKFCESERE